MIETPLVDKLFVGGKWLGSVESGETFDVVNAANGEVLAALPDAGREGGHLGIEEYLDVKYVSLGGIAKER